MPGTGDGPEDEKKSNEQHINLKVRGRGLKESDVGGFVEDVTRRGELWSTGNKEEVAGTYMFVQLYLLVALVTRNMRYGV
ncbi:hypothetical protein QQ045_024370 [Rhodiola kirilowii]